jgi:4'-phosphopantetheinyl transferase EntD
MIAALLAQELGIDLQIAIADRAIDSAGLMPGERAQLARFQTVARRTSWKTGRAALKQLCALCGVDDDTSGIVFPSPCYSLTHSSGYAVAVGAVSAGLAGIGIDLEFLRLVDPRAGQFFLTAHERVWIKSLPAVRHSTELLRLWTIKEALFKSDPHNHCTCLMDYALAEPGSSRGQVVIRREAVMVMQYVCYALGPGLLSVAVARERSGHDQ